VFAPDIYLNKFLTGIRSSRLNFNTFTISKSYHYPMKCAVPAYFPWFIQASGWVSAVNHLVSGLILAGTPAANRKKQTGNKYECK
jgi:hypothetical protein